MEHCTLVRRIYIADIVIPDDIEHKIRTKHNLTGQDVRESLIHANVRGEERDDEPYGPRLLVHGETYDGIKFLAWLWKIEGDEDVYRLGSAYESQ